MVALIENGYSPAAVFTQPDRKSGRGKKLAPSPVKLTAQNNNLPVYQPHSLKNLEAQQHFTSLGLDLLIVVAYGLILPKEILDAPTFGCINVHASLLPRWRGAAPIERAILAGDTESGVTIMRMDEGLDTGDMLYKVKVGIGAEDTRADLENNLAKAGPIGLLHTLSNLESTFAAATAQNDDLANYATKLDKSEALLQFTQPAEQLSRTIRVGEGRTPAYVFFEGQRLRILKARILPQSYSETPGTIVGNNKNAIIVVCEGSALEITQVQLPGKTPTTIQDLQNSRSDFFTIGKQFSSVEPE